MGKAPLLPGGENEKWTTTWATAPEFTGKGDMPQTATLTGNALRQIIHVSFGGNQLRMQLSNEFSREPVEIKSIYIADLAADAQGRNDAPGTDYTAIVKKTVRYLTFNGKRSVTIEPGKAIFSDITKFNLRPLQRLSVTVNYGETPKNATSHRGSRTTSYIMSGEAKPGKKFETIEKLDHWYNIAAIDVLGTGNECIAAIGNSITDGRGTTTNLQNRWTDIASEQLQNIGVVNLGIGGNCVLAGGLSEPAVKRFDRDVLSQRGLTAVIVYEGINDIGGAAGRCEQVAKDMIEAYKTFAQKAHDRGLKIYMATILPFGKCFYDDGNLFKEAARQTINQWIRTSKDIDGVIDFDQLMRDPENPSQLREELQEDWLHPNAKGYKVMGDFAAKEIMRLKGE
ncbi:MAG: SGNH/GDSL hydrolase family protein [Prevotella sp.]|nr:SGNH/GDSL hydrolase family protein [Prevotella sp.]